MNLPQTVLARQAVSTDGKKLPVYTVGAAAGALSTPEETASSLNSNPVAMYNTISRTAALVAQLTGQPVPQTKHGERGSRPQVESAQSMIMKAEKARREKQNPGL
jgi:hypothetical protein